MFTALFLISSLLTGGMLFLPKQAKAQEPDQTNAQAASPRLLAYQDTLATLGDSIMRARLSPNRIAAGYHFIETLVSALKEPGSFNFPFDSVKNMRILYPEDRSFRIMSWYVDRGNDTYRFYGAIQMNSPKLKLFGLVDHGSQFAHPEDTVSSWEHWYGAYYYELIPVAGKGRQNHRQSRPKNNLPNAQDHYILLGWNGGSSKVARRVIDVLHFKKGEPFFGLPVFQTKEGLKKRIVFRYSSRASMKLDYLPTKHTIVFDHLVPLAEKHRGNYEFYGPDLTYDGFVLNNGQWQLAENLELQNEKTDQDKLFNDPEKIRDSPASKLPEQLKSMKKGFLTLLLFSFSASSASLFAQEGNKQLTLEDIYQNGEFRMETVSGLNSMNDGRHYVSVERDAASGNSYLVQFEYSTGDATDTLLKSAELRYEGRQLPVSGTFSRDEQRLLLKTDVESIYRRSTIENNFVYDRNDGSIQPVSEKGRQKYAAFSPGATQVAFVRDNNIFIKNLETGKELQITSDGKYNHIINGGTDWVYEEEFAFTRAFVWSPDGKRIAYYKFDESKVKEYNFAIYDQLYPTDYRYKYPKPGEDNSIVSIHIYDLESGKTVKADIGSETDQYIPRIKWTQDPSLLCIFRMNRHQNKLEYLLANAATGNTRVLLSRESDTYIDINDDLTFLSDGKSFVFTSEKDGYNHIYHYGMNGEEIRQITQGDWEVTSLYGIDEKNKRVYFQSTESSPLQRDIYSISLKGKDKRKLSQQAGSNDAVFSSDFSYFINYYSAADIPAVITVNNNKGQVIRTLEDNQQLKEKLSEYALGEKEFLKIPSAQAGIELNAWMIKPADFDPSKKYPVFMYVYGGPGSQTVADSWGSDYWYQLLTQKGYIVVSVDNRGTGGRGAEFKKMTYLNLGKMETQDQIAAAQWLAGQSYVDSSRIGIYGWSYGGYMASLCITRGADVFKAAIAGAPVISWRFYDSIYTERYLRTPQENSDGYDLNSPIEYADQLRGKYLLIHGTADDNVHFQNSAEMAKALIKAGKQFESFYYPNEDHGVRYRYHLQSMMTRFILENL